MCENKIILGQTLAMFFTPDTSVPALELRLLTVANDINVGVQTAQVISFPVLYTY